METTPTTNTNDVFVEELQKRLLTQSDMISSANTGVEQKINEAIQGVSKANEASKGAIASSYDRQISLQREKDQNAITAVRERGVGVSTSDVAYKALAKEADQNLKDLEQRKQELMLQGDAAAAGKIAELQLQTLEFKTKAMQQTFTNLLGIGNFGLQVGAERRAQAAQDWNQRLAVKSLGLQYGVPVTANDTLDTVALKAGAVAGKKAQLEIEQMQSTIRLNNAKAAEALKKESFNLGDKAQVEGLINLALSNPQAFMQAQLNLIANGKLQAAQDLSDVGKQAGEKQNQSFKEDVVRMVNDGYTLQEVLSDPTDGLLNSGNILDPEGAVKNITKFYEEAKATKPAKKSAFDAFKGFFNRPSPTQAKTPSSSLMGSYFSDPNSLFDPNKLFSK